MFNESDRKLAQHTHNMLHELLQISLVAVGKLGRIEQHLTTIQQEEATFMAALDDTINALTAQVKANTDAEDSAGVLINGIPGLITKAVNDALAAGATPSELKALTDLAAGLKAHADPLAAAVVANTPAATP